MIPYLNGQAQMGFTQAYSFDRYGNRTINQALTTEATGINRQAFSVNAATNRLAVPAGIAQTMNYDNAGNLTFDSYTGTGSRTYDAENRMTSAADNSNQTSLYTYDADGRRVRRNTASQGEVWHIYGMEGELLAEYVAGTVSFIPSREYGYRAGQLLITAANGDEQRLTRFIKQLYRGALGRDGSTKELQQKLNSLGAAGAQGQMQLLDAARTLANTLFASQEYANRNRTNQQYVQDLYWAYFERAAEGATVDYWTAQLQSGATTRAGLCAICEQWGEFSTLVSALWGTSNGNQRTEHFLWNVFLGAVGTVPSAAQMLTARRCLKRIIRDRQRVTHQQSQRDCQSANRIHRLRQPQPH